MCHACLIHMNKTMRVSVGMYARTPHHPTQPLFSHTHIYTQVQSAAALLLRLEISNPDFAAALIATRLRPALLAQRGGQPLKPVRILLVSTSNGWDHCVYVCVCVYELNFQMSLDDRRMRV